jgi:predicted CXXCH cytochrome family protein
MLLWGGLFVYRSIVAYLSSLRLDKNLFMSALLMLVFTAAQGYCSEDIQLHHFDLACDTCHFSSAGGYRDGGDLKDDISRLCSRSGCHDLDPVLTHPVGITPKGRIPNDMPLDERSRLTCLTCHADSSPLNPNEDRMLHVPAQKGGFCAQCHTKMGGSSKTQSHWQFSDHAHLGKIKPQEEGVSTVSLEQPAEIIDSESRACLSCHDSISISPDTSGSAFGGQSATSDHPIGMSYQRASFEKPGRYFPLINNPQIRLFDGRVGCGSCHSLYSRQEKKLVVRNDRGNLCVKCHNS